MITGETAELHSAECNVKLYHYHEVVLDVWESRKLKQDRGLSAVCRTKLAVYFQSPHDILAPDPLI